MELQESKDKARRRSLGNIKFIGELFKLKMLTEAIMHDCVVKLLKNHDEESLECLCRLLATIGKDLDFEKAKVTCNFIRLNLHGRRKAIAQFLAMVQPLTSLCPPSPAWSSTSPSWTKSSRSERPPPESASCCWTSLTSEGY